MKRLQPVIWSKGTFLTPQHLQLQDRFIEDSLHFHLQSLEYRPWGFSELRIDQEKLTEGNFAVVSASGIFPDGLLFDVPRSDPAPASKSLVEFFGPSTQTLAVFLTIPDQRNNGLNIAVGNRDGSVRYLAELSSFRDENDGVNEKTVQIARKNLRLLTEAENRQGSSALQIASVEKTAAGTFRLNPRFVPPLLNIKASDYLFGLLRGLIEIMSAKSSQLSTSRRQKNQSLAEFTASDIANFWLLYTINSHLPVFNLFFHAEKTHPEQLYAEMASLAGSLSTFSMKVRPQDLPLYAHDELGPCFAELDERLRALLETVVPTNVVSLALQQTQTSIYATAINDEKYLASTRMYLAFAAEAKEEQIIKRVPQLLKVCSATHIDHLVKQALPGVQLTHLSNPPGAIPIKLKYQYFSLNQAGAAWEAITRARNFAAYVPSDFPNPKLELIIVLPQAG